MEEQLRMKVNGTYESVIGFKARIVGIVPGYNQKESWKGFSTDQEHVITGVVHRVTLDGKIYPSFILEDIPEKLFRPDELIITEICKTNT